MERSRFLGLFAGASIIRLNEYPVLASTQLSFADAKSRIRALQMRDDDHILPAARTNCYDHGRTTNLAVVLFHGLTNNPAQFARLAGALYERGCNVLVPRLPEHGDVDRMTTRLERLTADRLLASAGEAVDAARGLGNRLAVCGISLGAALCAWLATRRTDVDRCVCVAPALAINKLSYGANVLIVRALVALPPSEYAWWDPHLKERITPKHAYPRYPLRVLGECYCIGEAVVDAQGPFPGRGATQVIFAVNPRDGAVNNDVTAKVARRWRGSGLAAASLVTLEGVPAFHDIVEPDNPEERVDIVYPKLIELVTAGHA